MVDSQNSSKRLPGFHNLAKRSSLVGKRDFPDCAGSGRDSHLPIEMQKGWSTEKRFFGKRRNKSRRLRKSTEGYLVLGTTQQQQLLALQKMWQRPAKQQTNGQGRGEGGPPTAEEMTRERGKQQLNPRLVPTVFLRVLPMANRPPRPPRPRPLLSFLFPAASVPPKVWCRPGLRGSTSKLQNAKLLDGETSLVHFTA